MINVFKNYWQNLHKSSKLRVDSRVPFDFFWIKDEQERYGLLFEFKNFDISSYDLEQLKGFIISKTLVDGQNPNLLITLKDNSNFELFTSFCENLISSSANCITENQLFSSIVGRIKRWKYFLQKDLSLTLDEITQMGLFAELLFIKEILLINTDVAGIISSWTGADFDKQDFSLNKIFCEIKSFISSRGPIITVSSQYQLMNFGKPLYLVAYGLSKTSSGKTISDLVNFIKGHLLDINLTEIFENKLVQYGYLEGVTRAPLLKFHCDSTKIYCVNDAFPKISSDQLRAEILQVKYSIDLSKCGSHIVDMAAFKNIL